MPSSDSPSMNRDSSLLVRPATGHMEAEKGNGSYRLLASEKGRTCLSLKQLGALLPVAILELQRPETAHRSIPNCAIVNRPGEWPSNPNAILRTMECLHSIASASPKRSASRSSLGVRRVSHRSRHSGRRPNRWRSPPTRWRSEGRQSATAFVFLGRRSNKIACPE